MKGFLHYLVVWCLLPAALLRSSEPTQNSAATWQDSILLLIEELRFEEAKQELQTIAQREMSPSDQLRLANLRSELACQQGNWATASQAQDQLQTQLEKYAQDKYHDAAFAKAMQQQWLVRQASILLQGRTAAYFLQPNGPAPEDEIAGNSDLLRAASESLTAALKLEGGLRSRDPLWEPQQRLWLTALLQRIAPQTDNNQTWRGILQSGLQILADEAAKTSEALSPRSDEMQKQVSAAAELCFGAVRQLEPSAAGRLLELLHDLQQRTSGVLKHRLLLVQADLLIWRKDRGTNGAASGADLDAAKILLTAAWETGQANRSLTPLQTLELGLRLSQTKALEQNLEKHHAWRQTLTQLLKTAHESQESAWLRRYGRMLPVLESLVQECRATEEFLLAEYAAVNLLRLKKLLETPPALQVADAHALYAEFLSRRPTLQQRAAAIKEYNAAVALWQVLPLNTRRELRVAETQNTLASLYLETRQTELAEQHLKSASQVFEKQKTGGVSLAQWQNSYGFLQNLRGNFSAALKHYDQAEQLCKQALLSSKNDKGLKQLYGAIALNQIQCLKLSPPSNVDSIETRQNPGLQQHQQLQRAIDRCNQCLSEIDQIINPETQQRIRVWRAMFELERLTLGLPDNKKTTVNRTAQFVAILQGLQPLLSSTAASESAEAATAFYAAALCHYHLSLEQAATDNIRALEQLRKALQDCQTAYRYVLQQETRERPMQVLELRSLQLLGRIYLQLAARRDLDPALLAAAEMNAEQLARVEKLSLFLQTTPILQYQALETAAHIHRKNNNARAPLVLDQALQAIESKRSFGLLTAEECARNFARFAGSFDHLVDWYCAEAEPRGQDQLEKALLVSDRKRSRTFLDQIRALQQKTAPADMNLPNQEPRLRELQASLHQTSARLLEQENLAPDRYTEHLMPINREIENLLSHQLKVPAPEEMPKALAGLINFARPTQICYYHLGRKKSYLLHVVAMPGKPAVINAAPLQITTAQLSRLKLVLPKTEKSSVVPSGAMKSVELNESLACSLSNALLEHLQQTPDENKVPRLDYDQRLVIAEILLPETIRAAIRRQPAALLLWVPDGPLHRLPFEALTVGHDSENREQYLLDDAGFPPSLYTPSLAIYHQLSNKPRVGFPTSVVSMANPDYQHAAQVFGRKLQELSDTKREQTALQTIYSNYPQSEQHFFSQTEATEENFRKHAATSQLIHLGAHADASEKYDQIEAMVYLSPAPTSTVNSANDGRLSLQELRQLSYAECELAVLAACQTNVGQQVPLESGATIARAFLEQGARRVLCSQWNLADQATGELLCDFFSRLAKHNAAEKSTPFYAAELQQAKRAIRAKYPEPHDWAPLILIGCD